MRRRLALGFEGPLTGYEFEDLGRRKVSTLTAIIGGRSESAGERDGQRGRGRGGENSRAEKMWPLCNGGSGKTMKPLIGITALDMSG